jgi:dinuclear metal center YbgI/SA1388 family protein
VAAPLAELVSYLDEYLRIAEIPDSSNALNGLQVEGRRDVERIVVAVDASEAAIAAAVEAEADLLLVHHGIFWDGNVPVTGRRYRRLAPLFSAGTALYSAHLPLDIHPQVGNNTVLAGLLGLRIRGTFGDYKGVDVGVWGECDEPMESFKARLDEVVGGGSLLIPGGPDRVSRVGVLTGGGGSYVGAAAAAGLDTMVTGEAAHHVYFDAMEGGLNVLLGGHYATETLGVRALAEHLAHRFDVSWDFLDQPTGL